MHWNGFWGRDNRICKKYSCNSELSVKLVCFQITFYYLIWCWVGRDDFKFVRQINLAAYFHVQVTKTLRCWLFMDLGDAFLIPHEHPLRGDLLLLILLWENLIYHSNFNRKLKTHFLPPNWSVSKSLNSRLLHFLHPSSRYPIWPYCRPFLFFYTNGQNGQKWGYGQNCHH